jgi:Na+-transporting methylmalonyl-CoA/oxaloacetate decarboxylase gamma subunit
MEIALLIIVAVLFILAAVVTLKGRRAQRAGAEDEKAEARVIGEKAAAQQGRSRARKAGVKAASAKRASEVGSDTGE